MNTAHKTQYSHRVVNDRAFMADVPAANDAVFHILSPLRIVVTDALGKVTHLRYDAVGRLIETIDPLGRHTTLAYDKLDRLVSQTDPNGKTTTFTYDPVGNLLSVTDPKGHSIVFTYDVMNRVASRTDAVGQTETFDYDLNGNLIKVTDRRGQVSVLAYDKLNRLVKTTYADGSTVENRYDSRGRLVRVADSAGGTQTFQYDALGRLAHETAANGALDYQYDPLSRALSRQVVGQAPVNYTYDPVGNLLKAASPQASVDFSYDALNRRTTIQRANGVTTTQTYDALSRVLAITHKNAKGVIDRQTYAYDKAGNRKSLDNTLGAPYRTAAATAQYDAANRLIQRGDTTYTYDENGNRTRKTTPQGTTTYTWDSRNRLTSITEPNGAISRFTYDAFNNLIRQQVTGPAGNNRTDYLTDDLTNVIRQTNDSGTTLSMLTGRSIDDTLAITTNTGAQDYIARDSINSTTATTDETGVLKQAFSYEPYGQSSKATTTTTFPVQYTGRLPVADGLYYYRARFYDPVAGRFLTSDPIGLAGGLNNYNYVESNPLNWIDPWGLIKLPSDPSGLASNWERDPSHRDPNGERWTNGSDVLDFHKGRPGMPGWRGKDHWHHNGGDKHMEPGEECPTSDDPPVDNSSDQNFQIEPPPPWAWVIPLLIPFPGNPLYGGL